MASSDKPTFKGSCHCGFVTYTVAIDPSNRKAGRCNCTWCQKPGYTNLSVSPEDFTLLTPSSKEEMGDYNPKGNNHHRRFCPTCATHVLREVSVHPYLLLVDLEPACFPCLGGGQPSIWV